MKAVGSRLLNLLPI